MPSRAQVVWGREPAGAGWGHSLKAGREPAHAGGPQSGDGDAETHPPGREGQQAHSAEGVAPGTGRVWGDLRRVLGFSHQIRSKHRRRAEAGPGCPPLQVAWSQGPDLIRDALGLRVLSPEVGTVAPLRDTF